jgi:hypothetical protein
MDAIPMHSRPAIKKYAEISVFTRHQIIWLIDGNRACILSPSRQAIAELTLIHQLIFTSAFVLLLPLRLRLGSFGSILDCKFKGILSGCISILGCVVLWCFLMPSRHMQLRNCNILLEKLKSKCGTVGSDPGQEGGGGWESVGAVARGVGTWEIL